MRVSSKSRIILGHEANLVTAGDAMVRELDVSRITLRLREKVDKGEDKEDHIHAKLTGQTIELLRQGLVSSEFQESRARTDYTSQYKKNSLTMKGTDGRESNINVMLKFIPVKMRLDPSESINNMGTLNVEVHDATDLPAADRNGYSDPYCKFILNDKQVHKTETQKKTLHPAWNERFTVAVKSRTAAVFKLECWDWDRGDSDDLLGTADINLNLLEPFQSQEVTLGLDGKSGSVRLNMLFKPDYVTRSRQGASTFQGTFAVPGKIIGAPVKGVGKGAVFVGGNFKRGATFVGRGFRRKKTDGGSEEIAEVPDDAQATTPDGDKRASNVINSYPPSSAPRVMVDGKDSMKVPSTPPHHRVSSSGASFSSAYGGSPAGGGADTGTATFAVLSASGFEGGNVRVFVKQHTSKGSKDVHKTKAVKATAASDVKWDESSETFKVTCAADAQFAVQVKDVHTFGSDTDLGEGMLVVPDSTSEKGESVVKTVHCGKGTVEVKSAFEQVGDGQSIAGQGASPGRASMSRRLLSKNPRDSRVVS